MNELNLFIELAGVAGVFVGFGALISATNQGEVPSRQLGQIRTVVTTGLIVIVAALIPLALERYGFNGHRLWFSSGLVFFIVSWLVILLALRRPENRETALTEARSHPIQSMLFWLLLELPVQVSLVLILLGLSAEFEGALYLTALIFNLFQAAFVLTQFVYNQERS